MEPSFVRLVSLLFATVSAFCPKVICAYERGLFCGGFPMQQDELVVRVCDGVDTICQLPTTPDQENLSCIPFNGNGYDLWNPYYGIVTDDFNAFSWKKAGENCDLMVNLCGIELYCGDEGRCYPRKTEGMDCIQGECMRGLTCNAGKCIQIGSIPPGASADTQWACSGYTIDSQRMTCIVPSKTSGNVPKPCIQDSECTGSDGVPGRCVCGMNSFGTSYCDLHRGDEIFQKYLDAAARLSLNELRWRYYEAMYYPLLQGNPECLSQVFPVHYLYHVYKLAEALCGLVGFYLVSLMLI